MKYITDCQKQSGLIMLLGTTNRKSIATLTTSRIAGTYDHAISSLTLCELYGMNPTKNAPN